MSDAEVLDFLSHHGVKGMKWGVRNDRGHEGERAKTKKIAKLDKKFAARTNTVGQFVQFHNEAAKRTNENDVDRINNKPQYKNADFSRDTPLRRKYYKEHQDAFLKNLEKVAKEQGTNASGTQEYGIFEEEGGWRVYLKDVKHADITGVDTLGLVKINYDDKGRIVSIGGVVPVSHTAMVDAFLSHHGVKGMKWGVRNPRNRVRKASTDHKRVSELRKKKPHELSNKQLQKINARAEMERKFRQLNPSKVEKGHAAVKTALGVATTAVTIHNLLKSPAGKAFVSAGKKFLFH